MIKIFISGIRGPLFHRSDSLLEFEIKVYVAIQWQSKVEELKRNLAFKVVVQELEVAGENFTLQILPLAKLHKF